MNKITISLMILLFILVGTSGRHSAYAQEEGPLLMGVELTTTLGGTVFGSGVGFLVWLTDPGGPTQIRDNVRDGAIVGTFLGAVAGFALLNNAFLLPGQAPQFQGLDDIIGQSDNASPIRMSVEGRIKSQYKKPRLALTLINFNF